MLKLYYYPGHSYLPAWLLAELGVEYERVFVDIRAGENERPAFRAINPLGKLPVLEEEDGRRMTESSAICFYLAERFAESGLQPPTGARERMRYLQLMFFAETTVEPAVIDLMVKRDTPRALSPWRPFPELCAATAAEIGAGPWLFGDWFTAADVLLGGTLVWAKLLGFVEQGSAIDAYVQRLMARPALAKLFEEAQAGA